MEAKLLEIGGQAIPEDPSPLSRASALGDAITSRRTNIGKVTKKTLKLCHPCFQKRIALMLDLASCLSLPSASKFGKAKNLATHAYYTWQKIFSIEGKYFVHRMVLQESAQMLLQLVSIFDSVAKSTFTYTVAASLLIWVHAVTEIVMVAIKNTKDPLLISGIVFDGLYVLLNVSKILASDTGVDLLDALYIIFPLLTLSRLVFKYCEGIMRARRRRFYKQKFQEVDAMDKWVRFSKRSWSRTASETFFLRIFSYVLVVVSFATMCLTGFVVGRLFYMKSICADRLSPCVLSCINRWSFYPDGVFKEGVCDVSYVKRLDLRMCDLNEIPESFATFSNNLEDVDIRDLPLRHYPRVLINLSSQNEGLRVRFGTYPNVSLANLSGMNISALPRVFVDSISAFPNLADLDLSQNRLTDFNLPSLFNSTELSSINLADNLFEKFPQQILSDTVKSMKRIDLSGNPIRTLGRDTRAIGPFLNRPDAELIIPSAVEHITWYDINNLKRIPEFVFGLKDLSVLQIIHTELTSNLELTPGILSALTNLEKLNLEFTNIVGTMPSEIGLLTHLTRLDLSSTNISGPLPQSLKRLTNLINLDFQDTNLDVSKDFYTFFNDTIRGNNSGCVTQTQYDNVLVKKGKTKRSCFSIDTEG